jgi:hypothetical protein
MADKSFSRVRNKFPKNVGFCPIRKFVNLVVVGMCCVLSCLVAGFLLIVGVGGREPHESALMAMGMKDMLSKTTSRTYTMRKHRKSGRCWERKHKTGRA